MTPIIQCLNVSKAYKLYSKPLDRAVEWVTFGGARRHQLHWALRDVSLQIDPGEVIGMVGPNGAGKSTLLKLIARTARPTLGSVVRRGRVGALLELGAGFHPDLSGRDNIGLNARMLGFSEGELAEKLPSIVDFSGIGEAIDRPIRTYSSGMFVRLAFSIVAVMEPEALVIDEAIAVGDIDFQMKCLNRIEELRSKGIAIIFVTHDLYRVETLADRAICLIGGQVIAQGEPLGVIRKYMEVFEQNLTLAPRVPVHFENSPLQITALRSGEQRGLIAAPHGAPLLLRLEYRVKQPISDGLIFRIVIALPNEVRVAVIGHKIDREEISAGRYWLEFDVDSRSLYPRRYRLHASVASGKGVGYDARLSIAELIIEGEPQTSPFIRSGDQLIANVPFKASRGDFMTIETQ